MGSKDCNNQITVEEFENITQHGQTKKFLRSHTAIPTFHPSFVFFATEKEEEKSRWERKMGQ